MNLKTCDALCRLSRRIWSSSRFSLSTLFNDWMIVSTNPVLICKFAVSYLRIILFSVQGVLYSFHITALPLSVFIDFGTPQRFVYSCRNVITVSWLVFWQTFANAPWQFPSTASCINGEDSKYLLCIFLLKSGWTSSPGVSNEII